MKELKKEFGWEIAAVKPKYYFDGEEKVCENWNCLTRSDNGELLHMQRKTYNYWNNEQFTEFAKAMEEVSGFPLVGFDELKGGNIVLAYLKNTEKIKLLGEYKMEEFLTIGDSRHGISSGFVGTSSIMLRCANEFTKISKQYKIKHTNSKDKMMQEALIAYRNYDQTMNELLQSYQQMTKVKLAPEVIELVIRAMIDADKDSTLDHEGLGRKFFAYEKLANCIEIETKDLGTNAFGLFQGFTRYATHCRKEKEVSFCNVWGTGAVYAEKAFKLCSSLN